MKFPANLGVLILYRRTDTAMILFTMLGNSSK